MILCATSKDGKDSGLEFVAPPEASKPGDRIYFEGPKYESQSILSFHCFFLPLPLPPLPSQSLISILSTNSLG
jgi:hypothetical protein